MNKAPCSLRHTGIVVNAIDEWSTFLIEVLGFQVISDKLESGSRLDSSLGLQDIEVHVVKLHDFNGYIIELLQFRSHQDTNIPIFEVFTPGLRHLALTVKDIDATFSLFQSRYSVQQGQISTSTDGRVKMVYARGPEGCLFELVEELK